MVKISKDEVGHLSELSRLSLTQEEGEKLSNDIDNILEFVNELQELDVKNEKPFLFEDQVNIIREDQEPNTCESEEFLKSAPDRERQFFKVPRIL